MNRESSEKRQPGEVDLVASVERGGVLGVHAGVKFCFFPDRHNEPGVFSGHKPNEPTVDVQGI